MDFSIGPRSLFEQLRLQDTKAGLYPDVFCGDILSYKIADIHRISIEMAADVAAAIGRRALSRPLRDASLSVAPSHSSGSIARNFITIFLV